MTHSAKGPLRIAAVVVLLVGGVLVWLATRPDPEPTPGPPEPAVAAEAPRVAKAPAPPPRQDAWRAKRDRIRTAWLDRRVALPPAADDPEPTALGHCTEDCWGSLQLQIRLAGSIEGCRELLPTEARGQARFSAQVIAEPELGAVVESVEVLDDTIDSEAFRECIIESAQLAELADPTDPVSDRFVFRYTAGPPGDNAADFLGDHPELVERFPQLSAMLDRPADAPRSDEDATAFAQIISTDEAAMTAFSQWMVEQGVDLSNVRVDDP